MKLPCQAIRSILEARAGAGRRALLAALLLGACTPLPDADPARDPEAPAPRPEALSLLSRPLYRPPLDSAREAQLLAQLDTALQRYRETPTDADAIIWVGRRLAYLGRYREAIDAFSQGAARYPLDARFYRHRGHRYITTRQLENAVSDLERAAALVRGHEDIVEPDGQPNARNQPRGTLHGNIYYHLGLAYYLRRDFTRAAAAFEQALALARNDDMRVAASDWLYLAYMRRQRLADAQRVLAPVRPDMDIIENHAYHRRLLLYRGDLPPDSLIRSDTTDAVQIATYGYGLASWFLNQGDTARAQQLFREIVQGSNWAAFGFIAAEAELAARRR